MYVQVQNISVAKGEKNTLAIQRAPCGCEGGWEAVGQENTTKNRLTLSGGCF
jgi:hypothetical protein